MEMRPFTFRVETPIFVAREFFRHRSASYNEMSGRYTVMPKKFYVPEEGVRPLQQEGKAGNYFFVPGTYAQGREVDGSIRRTVVHCVEAYERMLAAGVAKEVARMVLPVNIYTQFYVTMNARNLMHFLTLRTDSTALYEIRQVAGLMEEALKEHMPITYDAYRAKRALNNIKPVGTVTQPTSITGTSQKAQEYQIYNKAHEIDIKLDPETLERAVRSAIKGIERQKVSMSRVPVETRTSTNPTERQHEITKDATAPNLEEPLTGVFFPRDPDEAYAAFTHTPGDKPTYEAYRSDLNVLRDRVRAGLKNRLDSE